jgi:hypothetical protein
VRENQISNSVPQGRLRIAQDVVLGRVLKDDDSPVGTTEDLRKVSPTSRAILGRPCGTDFQMRFSRGNQAAPFKFPAKSKGTNHESIRNERTRQRGNRNSGGCSRHQ